MKFNFKHNIRYSFLIIALTSFFAHANADQNQQKVAIVTLFKQFIDPSLNPQKKFSQWANEIIAILNTNPSYQPVCITLKELVDKKCTNPIEFYFKFKKHEKLLPSEVSVMLQQAAAGKNQDYLIGVFKRRLVA